MYCHSNASSPPLMIDEHPNVLTLLPSISSSYVISKLKIVWPLFQILCRISRVERIDSFRTVLCLVQDRTDRVMSATAARPVPMTSGGTHPTHVAGEEHALSPPLFSPSSSEASGSTIATVSGPSEPKWRRHLSAVKWFLIDQWFLLALGCLVLVASQVQVPASQQDEKEIAVTYLCVAVIFTVTGCTLPTRVLMQNYSRWKIHLFVQIQSFLLTSAIIYGVVCLCATNQNFMDPGLLVGMIFTGCVPTTISSNIVMTRQAHGNTALTVVQSTLGNLLGPFLSPLLIQMYTASNTWYADILPKSNEGGYGKIYRRVFKQLGLSLFLPLV